MKIKVDENDNILITLIDMYCNAHRTPWHWFKGWRNYKDGYSTYRISKPAWEAILNAREMVEDQYREWDS